MTARRLLNRRLVDSAFLRRDVYANRVEAGEILAARLRHYAGRSDVIVLGLPRGGVPVAAEVARALRAPLDVLVVRKVGVPGHRELAMGAIASGGARVLSPDLIAALGISEAQVGAIIAEEERELARREDAFRHGRPPLVIRDRTVILVDDGLATGSTMRAAVQAMRALGATRIVVAVPVGSSEACSDLAAIADEVVCARIPRSFYAVGAWYLDFADTTDDEVRSLLRTSASPAAARKD